MKHNRAAGSSNVSDAQLATKLVRHTPRNLQDVPSAYDIRPENAPKNIYQQSAMARMAEEQRMYEANKKNNSYRKILDDIQKMSASNSTSRINAASSSKGFN